jgi:hypothetical protein
MSQRMEVNRDERNFGNKTEKLLHVLTGMPDPDSKPGRMPTMLHGVLLIALTSHRCMHCSLGCSHLS